TPRGPSWSVAPSTAQASAARPSREAPGRRWTHSSAPAAPARQNEAPCSRAYATAPPAGAPSPETPTSRTRTSSVPCGKITPSLARLGKSAVTPWVGPHPAQPGLAPLTAPARPGLAPLTAPARPGLALLTAPARPGLAPLTAPARPGLAVAR